MNASVTDAIIRFVTEIENDDYLFDMIARPNIRQIMIELLVTDSELLKEIVYSEKNTVGDAISELLNNGIRKEYAFYAAMGFDVLLTRIEYKYIKLHISKDTMLDE